MYDKQIVIFGATGDLCRRKLIPSLFTLFEKNLLPSSFRVVGTSRRNISKEEWLDSLGYYPQDFVDILHWEPSDLEDRLSLDRLPKAKDNTYFLSVPPERYESSYP